VVRGIHTHKKWVFFFFEEFCEEEEECHLLHSFCGYCFSQEGGF
jgi:hypothetical protein